MKRYLVLVLTIGLANAAALLTNGAFEQELTTGWTREFMGKNTSDTIDRAVTFQPDLDYEARVKKYDATYAKLLQTVDIATTNLDFSVNARFYAYEYTPTDYYWAHAAVGLAYLDKNDNVLGETRICYNTAHCPYTNTSTFHMIPGDITKWRTYSFNVNSELANLPGVVPANVAKIQVALFDTTDGC